VTILLNLLMLSEFHTSSDYEDDYYDTDDGNTYVAYADWLPSVLLLVGIVQFVLAGIVSGGMSSNVVSNDVKLRLILAHFYRSTSDGAEDWI
jgi:hypothetical protein